MEDIQKEIIAIIAKEVKKPIDSITVDSTLVGDLDIDSLGLVDITFELEDKYGIEIIMQDASDIKIETVGEFVEIIIKLINKKNQA
jgi:acyl carrier protein